MTATLRGLIGIALATTLATAACRDDAGDGTGVPDAGCGADRGTWCDGQVIWRIDGCGNRTVKKDCAPDRCYGDECLPAPPCTPDCTGRQCGNDGCAGSCGTCGEGEVCLGSGTCCAPSCQPGRCGPDACGGHCDCLSGQTCIPPGLCCTWDCEGKACSDPNGCGGTCTSVCPSNFRCEDGACVCDPHCPAGYCGNDNCGGTCPCADDEACNAVHACCRVDCTRHDCAIDCLGNRCPCPDSEVCLTATSTCCKPDCPPGTCGGDGCGGTCACGFGQVCLGDKTCCTLDCMGKQSMDDSGCGIKCAATCPAGTSFWDGLCICESMCPPPGAECGRSACNQYCGCLPELSIMGMHGDYVTTIYSFCDGGFCRDCLFDCSDVECGNEGCPDEYPVCGTCASGFECRKGHCVAAPCTPDCNNKECGDDGCGGSCGTCDGGTMCVAWKCTCAAPFGERLLYCRNGNVVIGMADGTWTDVFHDCPADQPCLCGRCGNGSCGSDLGTATCPAGKDACCVAQDGQTACCGPGETCHTYDWNLPPRCFPWDAPRQCDNLCLSSESCCSTGLEYFCCPPGSECCDFGGSDISCCPKGTYCTGTLDWYQDNVLCCKNDQTSCAYHADGSWGACCTPGQVCSSEGECIDTCPDGQNACSAGSLRWCCPTDHPCYSSGCKSPPCCEGLFW